MDSILVSGSSSCNVIRFYKRWSDDILGETIVQQKVVWDRLGDLQPRCILKLRHIFPTPTWFQRKQSSWSQHTSQFLRAAHSWLRLLCSWQVHPQYVGAYISSGFRVNGLPQHFLEKKHFTKPSLINFVTCTDLHHFEINAFSRSLLIIQGTDLSDGRYAHSAVLREGHKPKTVCRMSAENGMLNAIKDELPMSIYLYIYMYICVDRYT